MKSHPKSQHRNPQKIPEPWKRSFKSPSRSHFSQLHAETIRSSRGGHQLQDTLRLFLRGHGAKASPHALLATAPAAAPLLQQELRQEPTLGPGAPVGASWAKAPKKKLMGENDGKHDGWGSNSAAKEAPLCCFGAVHVLFCSPEGLVVWQQRAFRAVRRNGIFMRTIGDKLEIFDGKHGYFWYVCKRHTFDLRWCEKDPVLSIQRLGLKLSRRKSRGKKLVSLYKRTGFWFGERWNFESSKQGLRGGVWIPDKNGDLIKGNGGLCSSESMI